MLNSRSIIHNPLFSAIVSSTKRFLNMTVSSLHGLLKQIGICSVAYTQMTEIFAIEQFHGREIMIIRYGKAIGQWM
jgi:hypothetical protein